MKKSVIAFVIGVSVFVSSLFAKSFAEDSSEALIAQLKADLKHARLVNDAYYMKIRRWAGDIPTYNHCSANIDDCELVLK